MPERRHPWHGPEPPVSRQGPRPVCRHAPRGLVGALLRVTCGVVMTNSATGVVQAYLPKSEDFVKKLMNKLIGSFVRVVSGNASHDISLWRAPTSYHK